MVITEVSFHQAEYFQRNIDISPTTDILQYLPKKSIQLAIDNVILTSH